MKAIICPQYGPPDVLQLQEVPKPVPQENEVLIKVHAAVVSPADCAFRKGEPFLVKLMYGFKKPKYEILGAELAGEVEAVGQNVTSFQPGDRVVALSDTFGAHAEYKCLPEDAPLVALPAAMSDEAAVGICDGGLTALTFLRDVAKIERGQKVLINGASGAVGVYAVQLAKHYDTIVTGVCGPTNLELVTSLGADTAIDYTQEDFTQNGQHYDIIFDAVGKRTFADCRSSLTPKGVYLTTVPSLGIVWQMAWTAVRGGRKAKFATTGLMQNKENVRFLNELFEARVIQPVIDRRYPLAEAVEAHCYVDMGHKKGNVILGVS